ncbi:hypothetical protein ACLOJK_019052 [Asimina triloba]
MLAFGFVPRGGFALSDHRSFDPAIPHQFIHVPVSMACRAYSYVDYSPMAVTLAATGNWPTLVVCTIGASRYGAPSSLTSCRRKPPPATSNRLIRAMQNHNDDELTPLTLTPIISDGVHPV